MKIFMVLFLFFSFLKGQNISNDNIITIKDINGNNYKKVLLESIENQKILMTKNAGNFNINEIESIEIVEKKYSASNILIGIITTTFIGSCIYHVINYDAKYRDQKNPTTQIQESGERIRVNGILGIISALYPLHKSFSGTLFNPPYKFDFTDLSQQDKVDLLQYIYIKYQK